MTQEEILDLMIIDLIPKLQGEIYKHRGFLGILNDNNLLSVGSFLNNWGSISQNKAVVKRCQELVKDIEYYISCHCENKGDDVSRYQNAAVEPDNTFSDEIMGLSTDCLQNKSPELFKLFNRNGLKNLGSVLQLSNNEIHYLKGINGKLIKQWDDLKSDVYNSPDEYLVFAKIEIPQYDDSKPYSFSEKLFVCLNQLVTALEKKNDSRNADIIRYSYGLSGQIKTNEEIGEVFSLHKERVRQLLRNVMAVFDGECFNNIVLTPSFLNEINYIKSTAIYKDANYFCDLVECAENQIEQIAKILSLNVAKAGYRTDQRFIVGENEVITYQKLIIVCINQLNDEVIPVTLFDFSDKVKNKRKDMICSILDNHNWIENSPNDVALYQLKWQYLSSVDKKVKRIIFENAIGSENAISKTDILEEYNSRSELYNIEKITMDQLILCKENKFNCIAKSGYWYYGDTKQSIREFISEFAIQQNGRIYFNDLLEVVNKEYNYPDYTIRTYATAVCSVSKSDSNLLIHNDFKNRYPEIETVTRQKDLGNRIYNIAIDYLKKCRQYRTSYRKLLQEVKDTLIVEDYELSDDSLYHYVEEPGRMGIVNREGHDILLDMIEVAKYDLCKLGKRDRQPEYRKKISSLIVNHLKKKAGYKSTLEDLYKCFKDEIPDKISKTVFYKIFDNNLLFVKKKELEGIVVYLNTQQLPEAKEYKHDNVTEIIPVIHNPIANVQFDLSKLKDRLGLELKFYFKDTELELNKAIDIFVDFLKIDGKTNGWGDGILLSVYELFFSKSDYYDRESYLYRLVLGYEAYLRNIKRIKCRNIEINTGGLYDALDLFEETKPLKSKNSSPFAKYCSNLWYLRNKYAHAANEMEDTAILQQVKTAVNSIALYVYTAWILRD